MELLHEEEEEEEEKEDESDELDYNKRDLLSFLHLYLSAFVFLHARLRRSFVSYNVANLSPNAIRSARMWC